MWQFWLEILALALLGGYLIVKHCQRTREQARRLDEDSQRTGTAFDASAISPRIQHLRQDYVAQLHLRPNRTSHRKELLASIARSLRQLAYFRDATPKNLDAADHEGQARGA